MNHPVTCKVEMLFVLPLRGFFRRCDGIIDACEVLSTVPGPEKDFRYMLILFLRNPQHLAEDMTCRKLSINVNK